jgi:hypothetical protein
MVNLHNPKLPVNEIKIIIIKIKIKIKINKNKPNY